MIEVLLALLFRVFVEGGEVQGGNEFTEGGWREGDEFTY